jgi:signal transduction histidine kinase/ActR/RegA family two-component response regulator
VRRVNGARLQQGGEGLALAAGGGEPVPVHVEGAWSEQLGGAVLAARDMREAHRLISAEAAEAELRRYNQRLEATVSARTRELEHANAALEERLSELHRVQDQLRLADRLASLGTLTAGIAHEINNPLAYVMSNLDYVQGELRTGAGLDAEARAALSEAAEGAERIRTIVRGLRTFSRHDDEARRAVDPREVLDVAVEMAKNEVRHRARLLRTYGPVPRVLASEHRLGQVFLNLLVNAAQAIPEGEADRHEVRLVTRTGSQGEALIEVHDTGGGIPADVLPHIFDPFFTTKRVGEGMGLGLSICHGIVQALGGTITVEARPSGGTLFRVSLPAAAPHEEAPGAARAAAAGAQRARVLVLDDEPMMAQALRRVMETDHEVVVETEAHEALERVASGERFDLILCDVMMPRMSGMQFCDALERLSPEQRATVVPMTGGAFTPAARGFLERQPHGYLEKPVDAAVLRQLLSRLAAGRSAA